MYGRSSINSDMCFFRWGLSSGYSSFLARTVYIRRTRCEDINLNSSVASLVLKWKRNMNVALINKQNFVFARFSYSGDKQCFMFKKWTETSKKHRFMILWLQNLASTNQVRPQTKRAKQIRSKNELKVNVEIYNVSIKVWMKDNSASETLCSGLLRANSEGFGLSGQTVPRAPTAVPFGIRRLGPKKLLNQPN